MAGTRAGGLAAAVTNKAQFGDDFYSRIGVKGGSARVPKGFGVMEKAKVSAAGRKGGAKSRRVRQYGGEVS